ncbi:hypothetical protein BAR24_08415 [Gluconobacter oxydans]|uniref:Hint domain-containing protein n=1 Tax=Gluconobacter thailandicus TaxID=257438 RepID=UPI0002995F2A|nr:Hint domain-containing protein [Gluconobacter thailandicus]AFV99663.1 hypothetical protein B932_0053 [Gluconobacter oxydans H24]ANQ41482.1 hypothetical protein BAR24_08415 [Gluconobacter oxydans]
MPQKTSHGSNASRVRSSRHFSSHSSSGSPHTSPSARHNGYNHHHTASQRHHEKHPAACSPSRRAKDATHPAASKDFTEACFLPGSLIATPEGERRVESLAINDLVLTSEGLPEKLVWVGKSQCTVRPDLADDLAGWPIRIRAGAIADHLPHTDLLVTAEHCIFLNGGLIPARMLVNGISIMWDRSIRSYEYFHIETEPHALISANGLLTESYFDTGDRQVFQQTGQIAALRSIQKDWEKDAAAPLVTSRSQTEDVWKAIAARAGVEGFEACTTTDPSLHLILPDGTRLYPSRESGGYVIFTLPNAVRSLRLVSRAARPCDVMGPFIDDRRTLGVLIRDIILFDASRTRKVTDHLMPPEPTSGWMADEPPSQGWTDGDAALHINTEGPSTLALEIIGGGPYILSEPRSQIRRTA